MHATTNGELSFAAVGDIMLGDHPVCFGHGVRSKIIANGFSYIADPTRSLINTADICFGNLETVLSDKGYEESQLKTAELRGRPQEIKELSWFGFNVLNVANNHALQHGIEAFNDTVEGLSKENIDVLGLAQDNGDSNVVYKAINGVELALIGYSMRPEKYFPEDVPYAIAKEQKKILEHAVDVKNKFDGLIIVSLHWGEEYLNYPSADQANFAKQLIDHGVSIILGHHPHVLQGIEKYNGGLIVYSLGNFIFDKWQRNPRETVVLRCLLNKEGVKDFEVKPVLINRNYQPLPANGKEAERILGNLDRYTAMLTKELPDNDTYSEHAGKAYLKFRLQSYLYFITHIYKYEPLIVLSSSIRFLLRRLGRNP